MNLLPLICVLLLISVVVAVDVNDTNMSVTPRDPGPGELATCEDMDSIHEYLVGTCQTWTGITDYFAHYIPYSMMVFILGAVLMINTKIDFMKNILSGGKWIFILLALFFMLWLMGVF